MCSGAHVRYPSGLPAGISLGLEPLLPPVGQQDVAPELMKPGFSISGNNRPPKIDGPSLRRFSSTRWRWQLDVEYERQRERLAGAIEHIQHRPKSCRSDSTEMSSSLNFIPGELKQARRGADDG